MRVIALLAVVVALAASGPDHRARIAAERWPCRTLINRMCALVTDLETDDAGPEAVYPGKFHTDSNQPWQPAWGKVYLIGYHVEQSRIGPDPENGEWWIIDSVSVTETVAAGTTFTTPFYAEDTGWIHPATADTVELADGTNVPCGTEELCMLAVRHDVNLDVVMAHDGSGGLDLVSATIVP